MLSTGVCRQGITAAVHGDDRQIADALHKAAQLDPLGRPLLARDNELPVSLAVLQQQQQQGVSRAGPQQQAIIVDSDTADGLFLQLDEMVCEKLDRQHAPTLVGYWCAVWSAVTLAAVQFFYNLWVVATLLKGRHKSAADWLTGLPGAAQCDVLKLAAVVLECLLLGRLLAVCLMSGTLPQ